MALNRQCCVMLTKIILLKNAVDDEQDESGDEYQYEHDDASYGDEHVRAARGYHH